MNAEEQERKKQIAEKANCFLYQSKHKNIADFLHDDSVDVAALQILRNNCLQAKKKQLHNKWSVSVERIQKKIPRLDDEAFVRKYISQHFVNKQRKEHPGLDTNELEVVCVKNKRADLANKWSKDILTFKNSISQLEVAPAAFVEKYIDKAFITEVQKSMNMENNMQQKRKKASNKGMER